MRTLIQYRARWTEISELFPGAPSSGQNGSSVNIRRLIASNLFPENYYPEMPMWDSGVGKMLKEAAKAEGCDFAGPGLHSFCGANITSWRQDVSASAIEVSKIADLGCVNMANEYTHVQLKR